MQNTKAMEQRPDGGSLPREVHLVKGVSLALRWCPPGRFLLGSSPGDWGHHDNETPRREVALSKGFWIGETPLTQAQFMAVASFNPSFKRPWGGLLSLFHRSRRHLLPTHPVEMVSWFEVMGRHSHDEPPVPKPGSFLGLLRECTGLPFTLPTEVQWEYACRAGSSGAYCFGDAREQLPEFAWYRKPLFKGTHPVGQRLPNAWGIRDVHGNVWEFCLDGYAPDAHAVMAPEDPAPGAGRWHRVIRGGAWYNGPRRVRAAARCGISPTGRDNGVGLRVCLCD